MAEHTPERAKSRLEPWRKRYALVSDILTPQRIGLLLAVALLGVVALAGGWQAVEGVEGPETPKVAVGEKIVATPMEVTVRRARHFEELKPSLPRADGYRYLVVSLDLTLRHERYVSGVELAPAISLDAAGLKTTPLRSGPKINDPSLLRGLDGLPARTYQPGLATSTIVVWQQALTEPIPTEVTITFAKQTWRQSVLDGGWGWYDPAPVARVTLPLEELDAPA